jgi:hypothetical protein
MTASTRTGRLRGPSPFFNEGLAGARGDGLLHQTLFVEAVSEALGAFVGVVAEAREQVIRAHELLEVGEHRVGFDQVLASAGRGCGGRQALHSGDGLRARRRAGADAGGVGATDDADAGNGGDACDTGNAANTCELVDGCNAASAGLLARTREPAAAGIAGCGEVEELKEYVPFNFCSKRGPSPFIHIQITPSTAITIILDKHLPAKTLTRNNRNFSNYRHTYNLIKRGPPPFIRPLLPIKT